MPIIPAWWHTPIIPHMEGAVEGFLYIPGPPGPLSRFQTAEEDLLSKNQSNKRNPNK